MRAIVAHKARDLRIEECGMEKPGAGEVAVRIARGGVCGSDLHYYNHGGFGAVRLREPMILGHEVSGYIEAVGDGVEDLRIGQLVAVSPSLPCRQCRYCLEGMPNHCLDMRFYGSAMPFPHIQGAFREVLVAEARRCSPANGLSEGEAAMAEPLSVCLHAARRAGDLLGKKVLVTGCGPIGALCVMAARRAGAADITVTDIEDATLEFARKAGADQTINVQTNAERLDAFSADKGSFDVLFECSGVEAALKSALPAIKPRGTIIQVGIGSDMNLPMVQITAKELELKGSFRFHEEFPFAVELMQKGLIDVKPLITHTMPIEEAVAAFDAANDRSRAMKIQIDFS
jgi:L-idonate 5-dehydrogenase